MNNTGIRFTRSGRLDYSISWNTVASDNLIPVETSSVEMLPMLASPSAVAANPYLAGAPLMGRLSDHYAVEVRAMLHSTLLPF